MNAQIYHKACWIQETRPQVLKTEFEVMLKQSGFVILNMMEHHFSPQGYTAVWLLAESHFAVHTFPEEQKSYCELSSCDPGKYLRFLEMQDLKFPALAEPQSI